MMEVSGVFRLQANSLAIVSQGLATSRTRSRNKHGSNQNTYSTDTHTHTHIATNRMFQHFRQAHVSVAAKLKRSISPVKKDLTNKINFFNQKGCQPQLAKVPLLSLHADAFPGSACGATSASCLRWGTMKPKHLQGCREVFGCIRVPLTERLQPEMQLSKERGSHFSK